MLKYLNISNLAVVDQMQVEFRKGLNILSGETGSGKSIIIDAVGLLLGDKASPDMIRTGESRAFVEGIFSLEGNTPLVELLADSGIVAEDDEIVIKRELLAAGRSRVFVNNQSATLSLLRGVQPHLVDIHGQGDQQSLLSAEAHLRLLDAFAGASELQIEVGRRYEAMLERMQELEASRQSESERLQLLDLLDYQIDEIERAALRVNEDAELEHERRVLANAEKLAGHCTEAYGLLYENEHSVLTQVATIQRRLQEILNIDDRFAGQVDALASVRYTVEEIAYYLRDYVDNIEVSPERLKAIEERLVELDRLKRKYAEGLQGILEKAGALRLRRKELLSVEQNAAELRELIGKEQVCYRELAGRLSQMRQMAKDKFEREVIREMSEVALGDSGFSVRLDGCDQGGLACKLEKWGIRPTGDGGYSRYGQESVEFCFSANPGEEPRPISAVASGGELSRLMLVLKTLTAPTRFPRTLIFDEIDAGIGGRVAEAVGLRLRRLAAGNQVLCVTHQAQIARYADAHFVVNKEIRGARTMTRIGELTQAERVEELARMIGGAEITVLARRHARELLKTGG